MDRRLKLHQILVDLLGSEEVYFQPPENHKMKYPCIVYKRNRLDTNFADDGLYGKSTGYMVTIIDTDPDSYIPNKLIRTMPLCRFDRHFTSDNLNHDVFTIYY